MKSTLKSENIDYQIENFKTLDAVREFVAQEYPKHKKVFDLAMKNELSQINAIAYDLNLVTTDLKTQLEDAYSKKVVANVQTHVRFPKSAHKNFKALIQLHNGEPLKNQRKLEMHTDGNIYYNTLPEDTVNSMEILIHTNNEELLIATEDMSLKYKVVYKAKSGTLSNLTTDDTISVNNLEITRLDAVPLTQKDYNYIKEAQ